MVEQFFKKGFSLEMCENSAAKLIIEILWNRTMLLQNSIAIASLMI